MAHDAGCGDGFAHRRPYKAVFSPSDAFLHPGWHCCPSAARKSILGVFLCFFRFSPPLWGGDVGEGEGSAQGNGQKELFDVKG